MTTQNIGLFNALGAKMQYLNQRQGVLAQNIANADTPGYKPYDLKPVDFSAVLRRSSSAGGAPEAKPVRTNPLHLTIYSGGGNPLSPETEVDEAFYDVEPSGNAVALEDQMIKATRNQVDYSLMTSLYQKNVNMIRTALGRGQ